MRGSTSASPLLALAGLTAFALISVPHTSSWAAPGQAELDPNAAGTDYQMQGEYVGTYVNSEGQSEKFAAQVVALGKGQFRIVGYEGGLPGAGWDGEEPATAAGRLKDGTVTFRADEGIARLDSNGEMTVFTPDDKQIGTAKKVHRKSDTLGMKPPQGATKLFVADQAQPSLANWKNGKLYQDKYLFTLAAPGGVSTTERFEDFTLHLEFLLPFMPQARGQGRANSGVYLQHRYECQILDSFGLKGKNNECGGFYKIAAPRVNMCLPPLHWQTYDFQFTAAKWKGQQKVAPARVTVKHNGVVIHEDLELPQATAGGRPETPRGGPIFLQNHGNPVLFRNIWILKQ